jgi:ubiquinone/menaquinone biosynthesis C-methylase UbiE
MLSRLARRGVAALRHAIDRTPIGSAEYWHVFNVTEHRKFASAAESFEHLRYRNDQYPGYLDLMPVAGADGLRVLDLGCGPGNDLVGFATSCRPARLVGADVSSVSLAEARARLALHGPSGAAVELVQLEEGGALPFEDGSFDLVHCSGVLHHVPDPLVPLRELRRVLAKGGRAQVMVYNRDSVWLHLYVAYVCRLKDPAFAGLGLDDAFRRTTDGVGCPISRCWTPAQFQSICRQAGLACEPTGAAVSLLEMEHWPRRWEAMRDPALPAEHREFLRDLTLDARGLPLHSGRPAGIDGCYRLTAASGP